MNFIKKNWIIFAVLSYVFILNFVYPDSSLAAASTGQVQQKLNKGVLALQAVASFLLGGIGAFAGVKVTAKHLPSVDDAHAKTEMWKSLGAVATGVIAGAATPWIVPWLITLFK
ncbi:hypothetical protein ACDX77_19215 [Bacillus velezensis]|uniref:hypothetical protein n=1 Tax=Bacillus velezensis TaxID=492670 RepID=UPI0035566BB2